jgi:DNA-binding CsgD family transcriptional regulator
MPFATKQKFAEFFRISFEECEEGLWLGCLDKPMSVNLPVEQQEHHLFKHAYLAECNASFAKMYGYSLPHDLIGVRFPQLINIFDPANLKAVRSFLTSNYRIKNVETHEIGRNGEKKYFVNNVRGVVEEGFLVRVWGKQKDITARKLQSLASLTELQATVLKHTLEGKTLKEISQLTAISEKSVDTIRSRLKRKFGADTIPQLAARAAQLGLFDLTDKL